MRLVQPVGEAAGEQVPVPAGQAEHEQRAVGDVEHRVGHRDRVGQRGARRLGAHRLVRHDEHRLELGRRVQAHRLAVALTTSPPSSAGADVVGVALDLDRQRHEVGVELEEVVGGDEAGDDRRRARAQPAVERDVRADAEGEAVGAVQALERAHEQVRAVARHVEVGLDGERPRLLHLDLEVDRQRRAEGVEPGPEVGRRGGDADEAAALHG